MYDGVVIDEGNHDFDVPKYRLEIILNCYNAQLLRAVRTKIRLYFLLKYNKLLHVLERDILPQSSNDIDRNSSGTIAFLIILKESSPAKGESIMQLNP